MLSFFFFNSVTSACHTLINMTAQSEWESQKVVENIKRLESWVISLFLTKVYKQWITHARNSLICFVGGVSSFCLFYFFNFFLFFFFFFAWGRNIYIWTHSIRIYLFIYPFISCLFSSFFFLPFHLNLTPNNNSTVSIYFKSCVGFTESFQLFELSVRQINSASIYQVLIQIVCADPGVCMIHTTTTTTTTTTKKQSTVSKKLKT